MLVTSKIHVGMKDSADAAVTQDLDPTASFALLGLWVAYIGVGWRPELSHELGII